MVGTLGTPQFVEATRTCARRRPFRVQTTLTIDKSKLYAVEPTLFADLTAGLNRAVAGNSLAWQAAMLTGAGLSPNRNDRVAFAFRTGKAVILPGAAFYGAGGKLGLACSDVGFRLSQIAVQFTDAIRPFGWFYPTDLAPPPKGVELGVVIEKPWYWRLLPSQIHVQARATCYAAG
jgi:hypothetical protein